ncbi:Glutathione S-transferase-like protein [Oleispira antarctica RB-8]|uniref:Glutathione S-transferase-like protein n=1 Tax=Oleispira antarctica RB-8 TaxID=698738 RepID=R4YJE8_OLEAN|nr:Glutathione S-transferase-like protein [Oleispira antarctica RB-8]|tara:strand:+ start:139 stop:849 length:711 start_codon:yes stop_codon:yes gene_type:complete
MSDSQPISSLPPVTNTKLGIFYSFRRCPYAMRARLACTLFLSPQCLELREVVLKNKPPELLAISPKATVPVLQLKGEQLTNSTLVDESRDIMLWALEQAPEKLKGQYLPFHLQLDIDELIDENDGSFKWALDRYKYADRFEEEEEYYRKLGEVFLVRLEHLLKKNRYLFTPELSLADIAIFPFVRQFAHVNKSWFEQSDYPKLIQWLNTLLESELFSSIMKKYKPWQEQEESILFP